MMMTLDDLYTSLSLGVLSNLIEGDEGSGMIPHQHQAKVINAVNQALTTLHGRFILQMQEVQIRAYSGMTLYPLRKIYADQDATVVTQKFISDTVELPFKDDVLKILEIFDDDGVKLPFDVDDAKIFLPNPMTIQLAEPVTGDTYLILYQAKHPKLLPNTLEQEVILPEILVPALEAFVAHLILSPKNGPEHAAKSADYYAKFEMVCSEVEDKDLVSTSLAQTSEKLDERGFI